MKAILEFNLPEEQPEFDLANNGYKFQLALEEFHEQLRRRRKDGSDTGPDAKVLEEIWNMWIDVVAATPLFED